MNNEEMKKLKAAALNCTPDQWEMVELGGKFGLKMRSGYQGFFNIDRANDFCTQEVKATCNFIGKASPAAILALITKVESLLAHQQHAQAADQFNDKINMVSSYPEIPDSSNAQAALSDADIVSVLHDCGIDTYPSAHGFKELQVSATSLPWVREVIRRSIELMTTRQPAPVASAPAVSVPEGWKLVPLKITEEMHVAAVRAITRASGNDDCPPSAWSAMLAASPQPAAAPVAAEVQGVNSLRNQMAYIAAYSEADIDLKSHDQLRGWAIGILNRAKRALAAQPPADAAPVDVEPVLADQPDSDFRKCLRAFAMRVAEEGIKEGRGLTTSVASDRCRAVVNGVLEWEIGKGLIYDLLLAAQRDLSAQLSPVQSNGMPEDLSTAYQIGWSKGRAAGIEEAANKAAWLGYEDGVAGAIRALNETGGT